MKKKRRTFEEVKGYLYILPWIIGFLMFQLIPLINSLRYSLTNIKLGGDYRFIGLQNYIRMFTSDVDLFNSMWVTIKYIVMVVPAKLIFALAVAMILSMKLKGIRLFRTMYYLPSILGGSVAISALWRVMFMKTGIVNNLLGTNINWLGDPKYALFTIDGAGRIRSFFKSTLPMISAVILFNTIMQIINALQNYTSAYVVTGGGPLKSTNIMALKIYQDAFVKSDLGYASAESWLLFVFLLCLSGLIFWSSKYWVFYGDEGGR